MKSRKTEVSDKLEISIYRISIHLQEYMQKQFQKYPALDKKAFSTILHGIEAHYRRANALFKVAYPTYPKNIPRTPQFNNDQAIYNIFLKTRANAVILLNNEVLKQQSHRNILTELSPYTDDEISRLNALLERHERIAAKSPAQPAAETENDALLMQELEEGIAQEEREDNEILERLQAGTRQDHDGTLKAIDTGINNILNDASKLNSKDKRALLTKNRERLDQLVNDVTSDNELDEEAQITFLARAEQLDQRARLWLWQDTQAISDSLIDSSEDLKNPSSSEPTRIIDRDDMKMSQTRHPQPKSEDSVMRSNNNNDPKGKEEADERSPEYIAFSDRLEAIRAEIATRAPTEPLNDLENQLTLLSLEIDEDQNLDTSQHETLTNQANELLNRIKPAAQAETRPSGLGLEEIDSAATEDEQNTSSLLLSIRQIAANQLNELNAIDSGLSGKGINEVDISDVTETYGRLATAISGTSEQAQQLIAHLKSDQYEGDSTAAEGITMLEEIQHQLLQTTHRIGEIVALANAGTEQARLSTPKPGYTPRDESTTTESESSTANSPRAEDQHSSQEDSREDDYAELSDNEEDYGEEDSEEDSDELRASGAARLRSATRVADPRASRDISTSGSSEDSTSSSSEDSTSSSSEDPTSSSSEDPTSSSSEDPTSSSSEVGRASGAGTPLGSTLDTADGSPPPPPPRDDEYDAEATADALKNAEISLMRAQRLFDDITNTLNKAPEGSYLRELIQARTTNTGSREHRDYLAAHAEPDTVGAIDHGTLSLYSEIAWRQATLERAKAEVQECKNAAKEGRNIVGQFHADTKEAFKNAEAAEIIRRENSTKKAVAKGVAGYSDKQQQEVFANQRNDKKLQRFATLAKHLVEKAEAADGNIYDEKSLIDLEYELRKVKRDLWDYRDVLTLAKDAANKTTYKAFIGDTSWGGYADLKEKTDKLESLIEILSDAQELIHDRRSQFKRGTLEERRAHYQPMRIEEAVKIYDTSSPDQKQQLEDDINNYIGANATWELPGNMVVAIGKRPLEDRTTKDFFGPNTQLVRSYIEVRPPGSILSKEGKAVPVAIKVKVDTKRTYCQQFLRTAQLSDLDRGSEKGRYEFAKDLILRGKASVTKGPVIIPNEMPPKLAQAIADMCVYLNESFQASQAVTKRASDKKIIKLWGKDPAQPLGEKALAKLDEATHNITPIGSGPGRNRGG